MANPYYENTKTDPDIMEAADLEAIEDGFDGAQGDLLKAKNNLSDLANIETARTNLGLGEAATYDIQYDSPPSSAYMAPGDHDHIWLWQENNLSEFLDKARARTNLYFGDYFTYDISQFELCTHTHPTEALRVQQTDYIWEKALYSMQILPLSTPNSYQHQIDAMYSLLAYLYSSIGPY